VRQQARQLFAPTRSGTEHSYQTADYQATHWLIEQQLLKKSEASLLSKSLLEETLETYLMLPRVSYKLVNFPFTPLAQFPTNILLQGCQNRLRAWQKLSDKINSSYQRLYLADQVNSSQNLPTNQREKLKKILIGFNFRQLALLTSQDELVLAQNLYPLIRQGTIIVKAPAPPFDKLPSFSTVNHAEASLTPKTEINSPRIAPKAQKTINIVCVDDSPAMLKAIAHFLRNQEVEIFTISDPLKALREIIRLEPKLILLDVGMPNLDGYHLSRLIRKHS
jgi:twitching motility two-component system response regulator PilG